MARDRNEIYRGVELRNFRECPYEIIDQVIDFVEALKETPVTAITVPTFEEMDNGTCDDTSAFFVYTKPALLTYYLGSFHDSGFEDGKRWIRDKKTSGVPAILTPHIHFLVRMDSGSLTLTGRNQFYANISGKKDLRPQMDIEDIARRVAYQKCWNSSPPIGAILDFNIISKTAVEITFNPDYNGESRCGLTNFDGVWKKTLLGSTTVITNDGTSVTVLGDPALTMEDVDAIVLAHYQEETSMPTGLIPAGDLVIQVLSTTEVMTSSDVSSQIAAPVENTHHLMKLSGVWTKILTIPTTLTTDSGYPVEISGVPGITKADLEVIVQAYAEAYFMKDFDPKNIAAALIIRVTALGHVTVVSNHFETEVPYYKEKRGGRWRTDFLPARKAGGFTEIPITDRRQYRIGDLIDP